MKDLQVSSESVRIVNPIGSTLQQRYQILEQLGHSGSVTTYLAVDLQVPGNLQLKCAIHRYELPDATPDRPELQLAISSAQTLYDLSRKVDRVAIVYSYFAEDGAFYIVREFVAGVPLTQELVVDRPWTQSQVIMLLADLLDVLRDVERCDASPNLVSIRQLVRRNLDRKLVLMNLPVALVVPPQSIAPDLLTVGKIAIAAATGAGADRSRSDSQFAQWQQQASQIDRPELIAIVDRLISTEPARCYPSIAAAWQAVVGLIPQFLVHQHSRADTRTEIARHVQLLVDRGTEFYEVGNCQQALSAYDRAISLDPQCVDAYCGRGNARRYMGDYPGSWEDFSTAVELDPDRGIAYIGRALAACFKPQSDYRPNDDFERGKNLLPNPTDALSYVMRGTAKAQLFDDNGAIADYSTAISLNPRLLVAYNNRGNLRQNLGDMDGALADFSAVLEIDPHSAIAYNNRAILYTQSGEFTSAVADYHRALEIQPELVSVYNNLGNNYCQMGELALAIANYTQALELDPEFAVAYTNRANVYRIQGDCHEALTDYDRAIALDPNLVIGYYNRGICHRQIGNHQAAIADYTQTLALNSQYYYAYYHRGNARQYVGDKHGAIADYTQTIYFDPNHLHAHYNRAIVRSELHDVQGAIEDLERAIAISPTFAQAYYQRGWVLSRNDDHQFALADYQRAIDLQPDYLDAYYYRGYSYHSLGDLSAAIADFSHSISIDPKYAPAYYQRGKIYTQIGDITGAIADYHQAANLYLDRGDSKTYQRILQILDRLVNRL
ncbi:tetratricopeptide repeat protein [Chamaesiphon minutus]|uniref:TPR repeat-containing protein n=1 Tax=Chamaesiphon minutus (strain ATCC 27169 / PCC 6605) TaxID=1173020 RepID=K9UKJ0_CHAP6|nr:tetratricopeptide repeat protein [Chamaesiphon minutus]AFY95178.1 TPR repeat-containing protein [Chamaesiphon minutus PCC 6605]